MPRIEVRRSEEANATLKKHSYEARQLMNVVPQVQWRHRTKPAKNSRTKAELAALNERRRALRQDILGDLALGHEQLWGIARTLFETYGTHSVKWWLMALIQCIQKTGTQRETTDWNAWLHIVAERRENGTCGFSNIVSLLINSICRRST